MKKLLIVSMGLTLCLLTACSPQPLQTIGSTKYYAEIDDDGEEYEDSGHTRYRYDLLGFDENGEFNELSFTAGHQLKQGAYLQVYQKKDEVITYEEVNADDIPGKAKELLVEED